MIRQIKEFGVETEFLSTVVEDILSDMRTCLETNPDIRILLSGGSTPIPVYKKLNKECPFFDSLKIGLVDERFVPITDVDSNERLLRDCFTSDSAKASEIIGMVENDQDKIENLSLVRKNYNLFFERTDIVLLGMGKDGHTASIFPNDEASSFAIETAAINLFNTNAPAHPKARITCGMDFINTAESVYLLITGAEKLKVLSDLDKQLPIHILLEKRQDIKIYYLKDD